MHARSWQSALWHGKCPRCRQGDIFKYRAYNILHFAAMHKNCPRCGVSYEPEPGFYYGAMFISYAFTVAIFAAIGAIVYLFFRPASDTAYMIACVLGVLAFTPWSFRYSRICFLYWFGGIRYDPNAGLI